MTHDALRDLVVDLAIGALAPRQAAEVEAHAEGCAECRAALAGLRATRALVAGLPPLPAPAHGEGLLLAAAREAAGAELREARFLSDYRGDQIPAGKKSVAFESPERTLADEDATRLRSAIVAALAKRFDAELRA